MEFFYDDIIEAVIARTLTMAVASVSVYRILGGWGVDNPSSQTTVLYDCSKTAPEMSRHLIKKIFFNNNNNNTLSQVYRLLNGAVTDP